MYARYDPSAKGWLEEVLAFLKNENLDHYPCTDLGGIEVWLPSRGDYQVHLPTVERDHLDSNFIITWPESEQATVDESNTDQAEDTEDTMDTGEPDGAEDTENTIDTKDTIDTEEPDGAEDTEDTMDTDEPDGTEEPDDDDNQESNASLKYRGLDPAFRTIIVAPLVPETQISLSWKSLPSRPEFLTKLHQFLAMTDKDGEIMVDLAATQSKFSVFMADVDNPLAMGTKRISRYSKPCKKSVTRYMDWFAKIIILVEYLIGRIGIQEHVNFRQAFYNHRIHCPGITPTSFKLLVNDIAITCGLPPEQHNSPRASTRQGFITNIDKTDHVDADESGKFYLDNKIEIRVCRVENVFTKSQVKKKPVLEELALSPVVDVVSTETRIRAVVVVEHRNLATAMMWLQEGFDDVIVMTQGFPTLATREFIQTLWRSLPLATPFLFYIDLDWQGAQVFTMIKYGYLRSAWASDIMVCPVLEWAGPTRQELLEYHKTRIMATSGASRGDNTVQKELGLFKSEATLLSGLQSMQDTGDTNTEFVKGKNAAELGSQGALNFSNAGHSSIIMASEPTIPSHQNMNENPAFNSSGMARERDQMLRNMRLA
ncbi:MAG: hypothetical protein L6R36_007660 [Xanthoria steineri]|nr:MAG: hypothetical protein L6R36_007660 [Xanthoria steineri]